MKKPTPFGKYYLLERINVGGMAEVFRAKAFGVEGFERLVAVKRILPNIAEDKEFIRMFIDEAKLAVQLNHANIAQIFDLGVVDGAYYIALEHVHGRDLRSIFDRCRQLGEAMNVAEACFVVMKVCEGLDYAHNKRDQSGRDLNLVHRDVSPQNVLVSFEGEVKLIDFGIAKAAGKGSKTQAGILKGKFGYMSPEQVRGMPVDRRSDVFSCGIVLYEMLTGERLFVGESDFSTLEKVRNVEILPPSTYNRKIPDELERIVLKALAKDVDDRYQNAIDLHDELQAFVYTAGEFYSRKDLAGQMKKTFGKEIEDETAKLESYRQLKPPPAEVAAGSSGPARPAATGSKPPANAPGPSRKSSQLVPTKPPPPPPTPRMTGGQAALSVAPSSQNIATKPVKKSAGGDDLAWDDDELETQIYDDAPEATDAKRRGTTPARPNNLGAALATAAAEAAPAGPDLSSLVSTGKGWEAPGKMPPSPLSASPNGTPQQLAAGRVLAPPPPSSPGSPGPLTAALDAADDPGLLPSSAAIVPSMAMSSMTPPRNPALAATMAPTIAPMEPSLRPTMNPPRETSMSGRLVASTPFGVADNDAVDPMFDPMVSFGSNITRRDSSRRNLMYIVLGGLAAVAVAVTVVIVMSGNKGTPTNVATPTPGAGDKPAKPAADPNTGFDLYVTPASIAQWRLDGELRTDHLPSAIRGISPGVHEVAIEAPLGFVAKSQRVTVEAGKANRVEVSLDALDITGRFESTPGAMVSLIVDGKRQELGESPQTAKLDPHMTYQVLFEKTGYVSVNKPIKFGGSTTENINIPLDKATLVADAGSGSNGSGAGSNGSASTGPITTPNHVDNTPKPPIDNTPKPPIDNTPKHVDNTPKPPIDNTPKHVDNTPKPPIDNTPKPPIDNTPKPPIDNTPKPATSGEGTLALGSKPPCDVFVDGKAAGHTPTKLKLSAGHHNITLVNSEFSIRESFGVDIKPDGVDRMLKDYSDKLPK